MDCLLTFESLVVKYACLEEGMMTMTQEEYNVLKLAELKASRRYSNGLLNPTTNMKRVRLLREEWLKALEAVSLAYNALPELDDDSPASKV